jgi:hypothetical protein
MTAAIRPCSGVLVEAEDGAPHLPAPPVRLDARMGSAWQGVSGR